MPNEPSVDLGNLTEHSNEALTEALLQGERDSRLGRAIDAEFARRAAIAQIEAADAAKTSAAAQLAAVEEQRKATEATRQTAFWTMVVAIVTGVAAVVTLVAGVAGG